MAKYNQVLQMQPQFSADVQSPSGTAFGADLLSYGLKAASTFMENQAEQQKVAQQKESEYRVAQAFDKIIGLDNDLAAQGVGGVKRERQIEQAIRSYVEDPVERMALRNRLSAQRGGTTSVRMQTAYQQEAESERARIDAEMQQMNDVFDSIPDEYKLQFGRVNESGFYDDAEKRRVIREYQRDVTAAQSAKAKKESAIETAKENEMGSINDFTNGMLEEVNVTLTKPMAAFFESVTSIDPANPQASTEFANSKIQARETASLLEAKIRSEYAALLSNLTDEDNIKLAEKRRDSLLDLLENFVTDIESSSLDVMATKKSIYDSLINDSKLGAIDAIREGQVLQEVFGAQGASYLLNNALIYMDNQEREALSEGIQQTLSGFAIKQKAEAADSNGGYETDEDFLTLYGKSSQALENNNGVVDPVYTDRFSKDYIYGADYLLDGEMAFSDIQEMARIADTPAFEYQMSQLTERQREAVMDRVNRLKIRVVQAPADGLIADAMSREPVKWNPATKSFELDESNLKQEIQVWGLFGGQEDLERSRDRARMKRSRYVRELNQRVSEAVDLFKQMNPERTEEEVYRYFRLPLQQ